VTAALSVAVTTLAPLPAVTIAPAFAPSVPVVSATAGPRATASKLDRLQDRRSRPGRLVFVEVDDLDVGIVLEAIVVVVVYGSRRAVCARVALAVVRGRAHHLRRPRRPHRDGLDVARHQTALSDDLVERDAGGHRYVEGGDVTEQGQGDEVVAVFAHETPHPLPLASQDEGDGAAVVDGVPPLRAHGVEAHDPDSSSLQGLEGLNDVADAREAHVLEGACGGPVHGLREPGVVTVGEQDSVAAGRLRGTKDRAQVARVLYSVEDDEKRGVAGSGEQVLERARGPRRHHGDQALVGHSARHAIEGLAGFEAQGNRQPAGPADGLGDATVAKPLRDEQAIEVPIAGEERLEHGVDSTDQVHGHPK
jgi:hypothetical protein